MRKSEIQFHRDGFGRQSNPAINVKVRGKFGPEIPDIMTRFKCDKATAEHALELAWKSAQSRKGKSPMPQFELNGAEAPEFRALDEFTRGYITALFWTSEAPGVTTEQWQATEEHDAGSIPGDVGFNELAPAALADIVQACADFQREHADLLELASQRPGYDMERAGIDFWLTRNHHGAGFWDRKELENDSAEYESLTAEMVANKGNNAAWGEALRKRKALEQTGLGAKLTKAAHAAGESDAYLGDDGKVYV